MAANYFRPATGGVYFGVPCATSTTLDRPPPPGPDEVAAAVQGLRHRIPALATAEVAGTRVGVEGYTPDRHPLIGPAELPGLYLATGMSGGGVKIAPAVGERVASELRTGRPHPALAAYRPDRYLSRLPQRTSP